MNSRRIGRRVHWWLLMVVTMIAVRSRTAQAVCPADVVPSGTVDVNDLLAVITSWGPCPLPCPPRCTTDIMPLTSGDCTTDVNDLLAVITAWGPCPCNPSGSWASTPAANYSCAFGLVSFNITQWTFSQSATTLSVMGAPTTMTGAAVVCGSGQAFSVSGSIPGSCTETYTLVGTFTSADSFAATFTATYTPGSAGACFGCTTHQWSVTGTRNP